MVSSFFIFAQSAILQGMKVIGIIPSRFASSRFPGKPLVDIGGKTMIQRVYEQATKARALNEVVVATDDERIYKEVKRFGGHVLMTSPTHLNGTERCAEVVSKPNYGDFDVVVNIQGDEPFVQPEQINLLAGCFMNNSVEIATLVRLFANEAEKANPSRVKAFTDKQMNALTFSRSASPERLSSYYRIFKHIGLYAFRKHVLTELVKLPYSALEKAESLEQLRWLDNGYRIHFELTESESISIDTPEDLKAALKSL